MGISRQDQMTDPSSLGQIRPRIILPGEGVGNINLSIRKLETQIDLLASVNRTLADLFEGKTTSSSTGCDQNEPQRTDLFEVLELPSRSPTPGLKVGIPDLWDVIGTPILPSTEPEDPSVILQMLGELFGEFIVENNRLILEWSLDPTADLEISGEIVNRLMECMSRINGGE